MACTIEGRAFVDMSEAAIMACVLLVTDLRSMEHHCAELMKGRKRREIKGDVDLLSQHLGIKAEPD